MTRRGDAIEMAKDTKYREILDAELDFQTGKLSEADYREVDRQLRGEASELLRRIDAGETEAVAAMITRVRPVAANRGRRPRSRRAHRPARSTA